MEMQEGQTYQPVRGAAELGDPEDALLTENEAQDRSSMGRRQLWKGSLALSAMAILAVVTISSWAGNDGSQHELPSNMRYADTSDFVQLEGETEPVVTVLADGKTCSQISNASNCTCQVWMEDKPENATKDGLCVFVPSEAKCFTYGECQDQSLHYHYDESCTTENYRSPEPDYEGEDHQQSGGAEGCEFCQNGTTPGAPDEENWYNLSQCDAFRQDARESVELAVGKLSAAAKSICIDRSESNCSSGEWYENPCTWCNASTGSGCYLKADWENPCTRARVQAVLDVAMPIAETAYNIAEKTAEGIHKTLKQCSTYTNIDACTGGIVKLCSWCNQTQSCHVAGSAMNKCTRDQALALAQEQAQAVFTSGKAVASKAVEDTKAECAGYNVTMCKEVSYCIPCSINSACYFMGDIENQCVRQKVSQIINATSGVVLPMWEWGKKTWTNAVEWGNNICGKWGSDQSACEGANGCTWCDESSSCWIVTSVENPCGWFQKGADGVKDWWNQQFADDKCSSEQKTAWDYLQQAKNWASENTAAACREYNKRELYTQKFMSSLDYLQNNLTAADVQDMLNLQIMMAAQAMSDARAAINQSNAEDAALEGFQESNPCATGGSSQKNGFLALLIAAVTLVTATTL
eukprot:CAMPEP_0170592166 /NCGR_PEP_ID=MMETSP0224-20130122/12785_1 /TAXON_ID=285029 /ORGANISM="Togula jolla, Strain CCCM 725" /LENGTH=635 /DNA_ID=CAMNT_0010916065 /DNA_START=68 /DNA_END=1975 /DNA_ORIENTATION=+